MKHLLLKINLLSTFLILIISCGNRIENNSENERRKTIGSTIPQSVKDFEKRLAPSVINDRPVLVRLSRDVDTYFITSKNGFHLKLLAKELGIDTIELKNNYEMYYIGFQNKYSEKLKRIAKKLDLAPTDKVITLDEFTTYRNLKIY